jgi:4-amino-4-deoxy-L-arabinose transferase-like glycosyltransferase
MAEKSSKYSENTSIARQSRPRWWNSFPITFSSRVECKLAIFRHTIWIILFAFVLRVVVRCYTGEEGFWENGYTFFFALAKNIAAGNGISISSGSLTAFRVPLYPMFLAAVTFGHRLFIPVLLAQSLIGAGTVLCAMLIARELFGSTAAIIAGFLTAIYPYYVVHDTALQETSLYTFLMATAVFLLLRVHRSGSVVTATAAGLALGAAVLTRANLVAFAMLAPLWLASVPGLHAEPWRRRFRVAFICAIVGSLTVAPWLIRAYRLTGAITLSTETGFQLWVGNNPYTFSRYPAESIDRSQAVALSALSTQEKSELETQRNEALVDAWFRKKGLDYIRDHPARTLGNSFRKVADTFGFLPSPRRGFWPSLVYVLSYGPVMVLGIWGMWASRRCWREHAIFYIQFVTFAVVTGVFVGHTSYRAYLDVYWIVFAAALLSAWLSKSPQTWFYEQSRRRVILKGSGARMLTFQSLNAAD